MTDINEKTSSAEIACYRLEKAFQHIIQHLSDGGGTPTKYSLNIDGSERISIWKVDKKI